MSKEHKSSNRVEFDGEMIFCNILWPHFRTPFQILYVKSFK